ncbi:MAG TPA: GNAT family N-acetyltransferase [Actinomycetota bacterium]|jgi:predicted acetyltransferase|nr:GNAT family N-acetyltransferase [Actinomycetota bacterium]
MGIEIRQITREQGDQFSAVMMAAFGATFTAEEEADHDRWFEYDRSIAAFDGDRMVGTGGAYSMELTLPGLTTIPIGGLTAIAVLPTHRRRGILRSMIAYHFADCEARGELVSGLGASESVIYGRFGYGLATSFADYEIDPRRAQFLRPPAGRGQLRLLEPDETAKIVPPLYDRYRRGQPGELSRTLAWWEVYARDPEWSRDGASRHFDVVYESEPGRVDGWVAYRVENRWPNGLAANIIKVRMLIGLTPEAEAALWRYLFDLDLAGTIRLVDRPVDEPVRWRLADPRRLRVTEVGDQLWLRLLDLRGALEARRYAVEDELVLEVTDALRPRNQGRFRLQGGPDGATCEPTRADPDLGLDIADLGAAYLGGTKLASLARAERVTELSPGAVLRADRMLACNPPPISTTHF